VRNHTCLQDRGYHCGRGGSETTLSERLPCGHTGHFTVLVQFLLQGGGDRFEGWMQDGTVTIEISHGRVGVVGSLPTVCYPELGTGVHALQSFDLYV
jgi:hypothetical protein